MPAKKYTIECFRAGAIGDVLMATPAVHALREQYPDAHIRFVTLSPDLIVNNPDIDEISPVSHSCDKKVYFEYPTHQGYPDTALTRHIAEEFAANNGIEIQSHAGIIRFTDSECSFARNIVKKFNKIPTATIHIKAGWSSYKEWPVENWQKVVDHFFGRIAFIQIGAKDEPVLKNTIPMNGVMNVRLSAACISETDMFVGIDSYPNHVAGALKKPAVALFGSTSPVGSGYTSAINIWTKEECSPCYREYNSISLHKKSPCPYDVKCQKNISAAQVINAVESLLKNVKKKR